MKAIRYYFELLLFLCFIKIVQFLKIDLASNLFAKIGRIIGPLLPISNIAKKNLAFAFPDMPSSQAIQIITNMWDNLLRSAAEFPNIYLLSNKKFYSRVKIIGKEHIEKIKESGKPCIFFTGHFSNWELIPKIFLDADLKLSIVYRESNNKLVDEQICHLRQNPNMIPKGKKGIKKLIQSFKQNRPIGFFLDQKMNDGIEVPFFGLGTMTASAPAKLALDYKCPIIPIQVIRNKRVTFTVIIHDPIHINYDQNNSAEIYRIMREINYIYEQWITKYPEQWFWLHKRWPKSYYQ